MKLFLLSILLAAAPLFAQPSDENSDSLNALVQVLGESDDPQFHYDILKGMSDGLKGRRSVPMPRGWEAAAEKLAKSPKSDVRDLAQGLSVTFGSKTAFAQLRKQLADPRVTLAARTNALDSLAGAKDPELPPVLIKLLSDKSMRALALKNLAAYEVPEAPAAILRIYPTLDTAEKRDALNTMLSRVTYAKPLLAAIEAKKVPAKDLTADLVRQLRNLKNEEINQQVALIWGVARETAEDKKPEIAKLKSMLLSKPSQTVNASRGRTVFAKACAQCHSLFDVGGKVGPDLTGSNRADLDYILENMVDPNAVIPNDYRTSTVDTKDDRVITGIITRQDTDSITVVTANETLVLPKNEVLKITHSQISMMPEGLLATLSETEVRDLVAYLKSPSQVPMAGE